MFPPAVVTHICALLSACVTGVMLPLGDRVRRPRSDQQPYRMLPEPLVVLVQQWLMKRRSMIACLMEHIVAGRYRPRAYKAREPKPDAVAKPRPEIPPEKQLPRGFGWIRRMAPEVGRHAEGLSRLLEDTEMKAMVLQAPQMARFWVPLLNAVGEAKPEWWPKSPPRPRKPGTSGPRTKRPARASLDPVDAWLARLPPRPPPPPHWWENHWPPEHPIWRAHGPQPAGQADPVNNHMPLGYSATPPIPIPRRRPGGW